MNRVALRALASILAALAFSAGRTEAQKSTELSPAAQAAADGGIPAFTEADTRFMQGMIHHHAQAIVMARMAASHGASASIQTLADRIDVSQRDEIDMMQRWLQERKQTVPHADLTGEHAMMNMPDTFMPGMLTPEQMAQLDKAHGTDFDRLFLTFMIQHHQGALKMTDALFGSQGAAQDDAIFKFASDVIADQSTEIDRMNAMLGAMSSSRGN